MKRGICVVIVGVVASGKTTVIRRLVETVPDAAMMRTYTTREPREGELERGDRVFVSRDEFERMIRDGEFLEWDEHMGHLYGSSKGTLDAMLDEHRVVFTNINVDGALNYQKMVPEAVTVFLDVPREQVMARIDGRGKMSPEELAVRMDEADRELTFRDRFDYVVENPDGRLDAAVERVREIIESELDRRN